MATKGGTERQTTEAQTKIIGKFCSRCRMHRAVDGGREVKTAGPTRWYCAACAASYDKAMASRVPKP